MAYASVTSLYHTIEHLLNSYRISVSSSTQEILKSAQMDVQSLQETLKRYDHIKNSSPGVMAVEARIRDEVRKLEDAIESQSSAQFLSQSQIHGRVSLNLQHLRHEIDCFVEAAKNMDPQYMEELNKPPLSTTHVSAASDVAAVPLSSTSDHSGGNDNVDMVGTSNLFLEIRRLISGYQTIASQNSFAITGMAGIGKTMFARKLFNDPLVKEKFDCQAFVTVGNKYDFDHTLLAIIAQLDVNSSYVKEDGDLGEYFMRRFKGWNVLIVLDDVWDVNLVNRFDDLVHTTSTRCCFVVTSRLDSISKLGYVYTYSMRFLDEVESWDLLRQKVFGKGDDCPPSLVTAGKKIAENCEGLPLLIVQVAEQLSKFPYEVELWNEIAEMKCTVIKDAMDEISEALLQSYRYLAQRLKACFLYMVVFPKAYAVKRSKINNLWRGERFVDRVDTILDELISSNLVVTRQLTSSGKIKAGNLHATYRYMSGKEAHDINFVHILDIYNDDASIERARRVAIYDNTMWVLEDVHYLIASVSNLRSVLCTGPYHQYPVPVYLELKSLRVLDAASIRFYEFPLEVVTLIQLRYLSLTTNANLPSSIHNLQLLQFLIVHQHLSFNQTVAGSYLPVEIWELQELEHLQIVGRNLPHPPRGAILPNLKELLDVDVQTCTQGVLDNIPNLEKLRVQIELAPDGARDLSCFDHISCQNSLGSLRCIIKNPIILPNQPTVLPRLLSDSFTSMSSLGKLTLSGFGYPWKDMSSIAELPSLRVLKLQCYAFRGEKWEAESPRFERLEYLLIQDTDLAQWTAADETFPRLGRLSMKNCHKLQEMPMLDSLSKIMLVDCNPLAESCAKRNIECDVEAKYSWK